MLQCCGSEKLPLILIGKALKPHCFTKAIAMFICKQKQHMDDMKMANKHRKVLLLIGRNLPIIDTYMSCIFLANCKKLDFFFF